jgi:hypothetical protein
VLDITLIENIYKFLKDLETDGFIAKDINLKNVYKMRNGSYFRKYKDLNELYLDNKEDIDNPKPNRYCSVGDYCFIENIKFENTVSNYLSEFYFYNITSKNPKIRDKTNFDYSRNEFYAFDKSKYIEYLKESLLSNFDRNVDLANTRLSNYVDACYVDPNYVDSIPRINDSIINDL